jgi:hypothetical protein
MADGDLPYAVAAWRKAVSAKSDHATAAWSRSARGRPHADAQTRSHSLGVLARGEVRDIEAPPAGQPEDEVRHPDDRVWTLLHGYADLSTVRCHRDNLKAYRPTSHGFRSQQVPWVRKKVAYVRSVIFARSPTRGASGVSERRTPIAARAAALRLLSAPQRPQPEWKPAACGDRRMHPGEAKGAVERPSIAALSPGVRS